MNLKVSFAEWQEKLNLQVILAVYAIGAIIYHCYLKIYHCNFFFKILIQKKVLILNIQHSRQNAFKDILSNHYDDVI